MDLRVNDRLTIPEDEIGITFARSGGPGGQNVNKVETKVQVRWRPADSVALSEADRAWILTRLASRLTTEGDLLITSSRTRQRERNREDALQKLAATIRTALHRPLSRRKTKPTRSSVERRLDTKRHEGRKKRDRKKPRGDWE